MSDNSYSNFCLHFGETVGVDFCGFALQNGEKNRFNAVRDTSLISLDQGIGKKKKKVKSLQKYPK